MQYEHIQLERHDGVVLLALNQPKQRNALSLEMRAEVADAISVCRDDDGCKAMVVTGRGGSFCAGGDLKSLKDGDERAVAARVRIQRLHDWFGDFVNFPKPVITAVNGPCAGAGFSFALAGDAIICTESAWFCQVFGRIGVVPDMGSLYLLPRRIGMQAAKELIYTARRLGAAEAKEYGLVHSIVNANVLEQSAIALAKQFANIAPQDFARGKNVMNHSFELPMERFLNTVEI